jgi:hypothetical protein
MARGIAQDVVLVGSDELLFVLRRLLAFIGDRTLRRRHAEAAPGETSRFLVDS